MGKNTLLRMSRRFLHNTFFSRFGSKGKAWKSVCNKIYPEYMYRQKGDWQTKERCKEYSPYLTRIARHGIFYEFAYIVKYPPPLFYCLHNGCKIIIKQYHVGSLF